METYKIIVEYDGSRYKGYKKNKKGSTASIQEKIEAVLSRLEDGNSITLQVAVPTEVGVHSMGQVLSYRTTAAFTPKTIKDYMNRYLPQDIVVRQVSLERENFHAEFNKTGICYEYRIQTAPYQNVMEHAYMEYIPEPLDLPAIGKAMELLTGTLDLAVFNGNPKLKKSTLRKVEAFDMQVEKESIRLICTVDDVFVGMMQAIFGTLIKIGMHQLELSQLEARLLDHTAGSLCYLAPAKALTLMYVLYGDNN